MLRLTILKITFIATLYALAVSLLPLQGLAPLTPAQDVQTAIFTETTTHMMSLETMNEMYPFKGPGKPMDIAKMAVVLASDDASWMTGAIVAVDGGYTCR